MRVKPVHHLTSFALTFAVLSLAPSSATADDAFLCNDGSIVKVAHNDLAWMKRNNACIAAHFGLEAPEIVTPPLPNRRTDIVAPKPRHARLAAHRPSIQRTKAKPLPKLAKRAPASNLVDATSEKPDFRNVVILNATPGAASVFRHRF